MTIKIYTDGGCDRNPGGTGGWAYRLLMEGCEPVEAGGRVECTTNNRMELTAAVRALEALENRPPGESAAVDRIEIHSDSQYLVRGMNEWVANWIRQGWKLRDGGEVKNADLWKRLLELESDCSVTWNWVQGHATDPDNIRVDRLVQEAIKPKTAAVAPLPSVPADVKLIRKDNRPAAVTITTPSRTQPGKKVSVRIDWPHVQPLIEDLIKAQHEGEEP
jgi:ribonuclease HI